METKKQKISFYKKIISDLEKTKQIAVDVMKKNSYSNETVRDYNIICCKIFQIQERIKYLRCSKNKREYFVKEYTIHL